MAKSESDMISTPRTGQVITGRERDAVFCMWEQPYQNLRTLRRRRDSRSAI